MLLEDKEREEINMRTTLFARYKNNRVEVSPKENFAFIMTEFANRTKFDKWLVTVNQTEIIWK